MRTKLDDAVFSLELDLDGKHITMYDAEMYHRRVYNYREFGALILEMARIRDRMVVMPPPVDPWADPDMFTSGLD